MFNGSHKDFACLLNILESIEKIKQYSVDCSNSDDFFSESKTFDAALMNFIIIGEMAERLSENFKHSSESEIDWFKIRGFRNIIAHNYFGIDAEEVWQIINTTLPDLETKIKRIVHH
ncbi:DUF86 domain-containing protein [Marinilabilia salmonicolor]|jgi:uncharacterized protein with HEPN domain|uniref:Uncharacterized protein with HEPN domain n=1 Tax=Marinilabilia salmonicolor TaxID=989 RepID=A0A2T0XPH0_9BACT|nr:HepT-like ribonuclease domain-containing protein [Marinilabilia salmonicolor]PRZ00834.1 uncharacterized protein with HEPN domain [Marinilabilia salmonicolor]RCW30430.1 uncharacterized protein with HEPN domain [Marinilabilia salmonicolor]